MKPGLLKSPRVIEWLRGKEPAWTLLTFQGWCALHGKPSETGCAPSLSGDTSSTRALNATFLFRIGPETKPTTTGNLTRAFVAEMVAAFLLPDSDPVKALVRRIVANEPDFTPLHAVRIFCDLAKLVCVEGRQSRLTKKAQTLVAKGNVGKLNRLLFDAAYWNTNLAYFDGFRLAPWLAPVRRRERLAKARRSRSPVRGPVIGVLEAERDELGAISRRAYSEFLHGSICSKRSRLRMKIGPSWNVADIENPRHSMRSSISL